VGRTNQNEDDRWEEAGGLVRYGNTSGGDFGDCRSGQLNAAEMDNAVDRTRQLPGLVGMLV
jgi:hypothetical protein